MTDNEKPDAGGAGLSKEVSSEGRNSAQPNGNGHFPQRICVEETLQFFDVIRPAAMCTFQAFADLRRKRTNLAIVLYGAGHERALADLNQRGAETGVGEVR